MLVKAMSVFMVLQIACLFLLIKDPSRIFEPIMKIEYLLQKLKIVKRHTQISKKTKNSNNIC
jgi:hypothetical protein